MLKRYRMIKCIEEILNVKFNDNDLTDRIYIKMNILFKYLNTSQNYESLNLLQWRKQQREENYSF